MLGIRAKGTFDKKQRGVHAGKQKLGVEGGAVGTTEAESAFLARGEKRERKLVCMSGKAEG